MILLNVIMDTYNVIRLVRALGFAIAWNKTSDPCQVVTNLGTYFDSISMTVSLPPDKLEKFAAVLREFCGRTRASKHQLKRLAGKLAYAVHVVNATGRTYLQHVLNLLHRLLKPSYKVKLILSGCLLVVTVPPRGLLSKPD